jgi:hypothetical protein
MMKLALKYQKQILRIYVYNLFYVPPPQNRFDSALLEKNGKPRKAYFVLREHYANYFN